MSESEYSAYAVMCDCKNVGKRFAGSKRRVAWKFVFAEDRERVHEVVMKHSIVSGKREITMDGNPIHISKKMNMKTDFNHPFDFPGHLLRVAIKETVDRFVYSLFIDNVPFRHLPHNSQVATKATKKGSSSSSSKSKGGTWDPFAEAEGGSSNGNKKEESNKSNNVKTKKSMSDWVSFGDDGGGDSKKKSEKKKEASAGDLLSDVFASTDAVVPPPTPITPPDLFGSNTADTQSNGTSLSDLSSLYAATNSVPVKPIPAPTVVKTTTGTRGVQKQESWGLGGLVDLNDIASPMKETAPHPMDAFNTYNMRSPQIPSTTAVRQTDNFTFSSPGTQAPRGMNFHTAKPTHNPNAKSNNRRMAAPSAFEADPFARFS